MKKIAVLSAAIFIVIVSATKAFPIEAESPTPARVKDPVEIFYGANSLYEKGDYTKAIEEYLKILDGGLESGSLYYNIGNSFFKLNKLGYAIYCYEKAKRFMPGDGDLKSNLDYARSLAGTADYPESMFRSVMKQFFYPVRQMNINSAAVLAVSVYVLTILLSAFFIANRILVKRYGIILWFMIAVCVYCVLAFGIKYYHEVVVKFGITVGKDVECRYEPIDKSTIYFTMPEGEKVVVVKTRNGWRQVRRLDGKTGWVEKSSVQEI